MSAHENGGRVVCGGVGCLHTKLEEEEDGSERVRLFVWLCGVVLAHESGG